MAFVIPVQMQPEPADFNDTVRMKGGEFLAKNHIDPGKPLPEKAEIPPYWRRYLPQLHKAYHGICAYLCVYFEESLGAGTVDHFLPKSLYPGEAYEWKNYRLACSRMNSESATLN